MKRAGHNSIKLNSAITHGEGLGGDGCGCDNSGGEFAAVVSPACQGLPEYTILGQVFVAVEFPPLDCRCDTRGQVAVGGWVVATF